MRNYAGRIIDLLQTNNIPVVGVSVDINKNVSVEYASNVTVANKTTVANLISAFDWSDSAQDNWEKTFQRSGAKNIYNNIDPFSTILRAVVLVITDEINILRAKVALAARTTAQVKTAILSKLDSGDADS